MSELRRGGIDTPVERVDAPAADAAPDTGPVDQRRAIPAQKEFLREAADREPDASGDVPHAIDWATGRPTGDPPGEVGRVDDPLAQTRPYDRHGGLDHPDQRDQWSLEHVVPRDADGRPEKHPSTDGEWTAYVNDGGPEADPLRGNNCLDCSLAALATWHGEPTVAAPRTTDMAMGQHLDTASGGMHGPGSSAAIIHS